MASVAGTNPIVERVYRGHKGISILKNNHLDVVTGLSFKQSMTQLASSSSDNSVMVWNFKPQLRAFRFCGHKAIVTDVDFSPNTNLLASCSRDKTVRLWSPTVRGDVTCFNAHTSSVRTVSFNSDSQKLLTASDDKTVKVWATSRTKFLCTLTGHLNWVRTAKFSPDSRLLVSGSDDKTVKLWDLNSKSCVKTYWDHVGMVSSVAFHPGGTIIASASMDKSIKLFDVRTHKLIQHYGDAHSGISENNPSPHESHLGGVNSISFGGPNGEWMISTGMDGLVKIWDLKEGHLLYTLYGHKYGSTTAAVFSPDGKFFATGGSDSLVMVWKSNLDSISGGDSIIGESNNNTRKNNVVDNNSVKVTQFSPPKSAATTILPIFGEPGVNKTVGKERFAPNVARQAGGMVKNFDVDRDVEIVNVGSVLFNIPGDDGNDRETKNTHQEEPKLSSKSHDSFYTNTSQTKSHQILEGKKIQLEEKIFSEKLTESFEKIDSHLSILNETLQVLEGRISFFEDRMEGLEQKMNTGSILDDRLKTSPTKTSSQTEVEIRLEKSELKILELENVIKEFNLLLKKRTERPAPPPPSIGTFFSNELD